METKNTTYLGNNLVLRVIETPTCSALKAKCSQQICGCLTHKLKTLQSIEKKTMPEEIRQALCSKKIGLTNNKIAFKTCGRGAITVSLSRKDGTPMNSDDITKNQQEIIDLINTLFEDYDHFHILKGTLNDNLIYNKEHGRYELEFVRGIPKKEAELHFPNIIEAYTNKLIQ